MKRNLRLSLMAAAVGIVLALPACRTTDPATCAACQGKGCAKCAPAACEACGGKGCPKCAKPMCEACGGKGCAKCKPGKM